MKIGIIISCISFSTVIGCASTTSIVESTRAKSTEIEEGIVYSLPKQLVKVQYTRKAIDSTKAASALKKAKESFVKLNTSLGEKKKEEKKVSELIKNIDPNAENKPALEAKLQLELTKIKAEKLVLTKAVSAQTTVVSVAEDEYARSLQADDAFSEKIKITPEKPVPDSENTFYARVIHGGGYSDVLDVSLKNGMLDGAIGHSEDKTGEIIVSIAGGLAGLSPPSSLGISAFQNFTINPETTGQGGCTKKPAISVTQIIDPESEEDRRALNSSLEQACIKIDINLPNTNQVGVLAELSSIKGLVYRQPGTYEFGVRDIDSNMKIQTMRLSLTQGGQLGYISMPKANFAKNEYDISFSNGVLVKSRINQPSEILGAAMILPNALKQIFAIPTELIQLKVDYSTSEKTLLELKQGMLEAQIEIDKKQLEIESSQIIQGQSL